MHDFEDPAQACICKIAVVSEETFWVCKAEEQCSIFCEDQQLFSRCMRHIKQNWHVLLSMLHVKGKMGKDMD